MVSLGRASVQPAEQIAGKVDLAKFQWKVRDPRGLRGGAVAGQKLLATSKLAPSPPWRSWSKDEKTTERNAQRLSNVVENRGEPGVANVVSGQITTDVRSAHTDSKRRRLTNNFLQRCMAHPCYHIVTMARSILHVHNHPKMPSHRVERQ